MILYQMPFESLCRKYNLCPGLPSLSYFFGNGINFLEREPRGGAGPAPGRAAPPPGALGGVVWTPGNLPPSCALCECHR